MFVLGVGVWAKGLAVVRDNAWYAVLFIAFTVATSLVELLRQGVFVAYRRTQSSLAVEVAGGSDCLSSSPFCLSGPTESLWPGVSGEWLPWRLD